MIDLSYAEDSLVSATVLAQAKGRIIASLNIYDLDCDPFIDGVHVEKSWRRQGIATAMWAYALEHCPDLSHSRERTPVGDAWARSLGGPLPSAQIVDPARYRYDDVVIEARDLSGAHV